MINKLDYKDILDFKRVKGELANWFKLVFTLRGAWMFIPGFIALLYVYLIDKNYNQPLEARMDGIFYPSDLIYGNVNEYSALVLMSIAVLIFFIRLCFYKYDLDKVLLALSVSFLCREIHFTGTDNGIYVACSVIFIWCIIWNKRLFTELNLSEPVKLVSFGMFYSYLFTLLIQRRALKRLFPESLLDLEQQLHIPWEETTENVAHLFFILLGIMCFTLTKKSEKKQRENLLGKGRSANVYKEEVDGKAVARKVFTGTDLTNFILTIFYGAPVDYQWCDAAIKSSFHRRKVLRGLLKYWFGDSLVIADSYGTGFDYENNEQYLDTEFINGREAKLHTPFQQEKLKEYPELKKEILPKLQHKLMNSGMVGTVWQAGYGQPCAIANFMFRKNRQEGESKWVWIDAESGVPAIVSFNIFKQLRFYIPKAIKHRKVLFDDLDPKAFKQYLNDNGDDIKAALGDSPYREFQEHAEKLIVENDRWQSETRRSRSMNYFRYKGRINDEQYEFYKKHGILWYGVITRQFIKDIFPKLAEHTAKKICKYAGKLNPFRFVKFTFNSLISREYRITSSHDFVLNKIVKWYELGRLTDDQKNELVVELDNAESKQYLSDFGVFLMFKPLGLFVKLCVVPFMVFMGWLTLIEAGGIAVFFSPCIRTLYILIRMIEDLFKGYGCPWIALIIAPIPSLGTLAHPCQMIHSATKGHMISQFIVYEVMSTIAKKIPIFGGYNSEVEYFFNNLAFAMVRFSL